MFFPILLLVLLFFYLDPRQNRRGSRDYGYRDDRDENSALDILDRRFAEGDISEEEYMKRKNLLRPRK
jgi:putative membrane protein